MDSALGLVTHDASTSAGQPSAGWRTDSRLPIGDAREDSSGGEDMDLPEPPRPDLTVATPPPASPTVQADGMAVATAFAALAVVSLATAAIHFAVMGEHFEEYAPFGVFFSVVAWLQALWALAVIVAPSRRVLVSGLVGNALVVVVWLVSRTTGLPLGPEPGAPEPAAFLDVLSTLLEVGIVIGTAALLVRRPGLGRGRRGGAIVVTLLAILLMVLTTAAVAAEDHGAHSDEPGTHMEGG